jgi:hypothetical protein|tara:strand:+ start:71 stop:499 length:429 start_codon:yes stop_codon:yes gene_type:complete
MRPIYETASDRYNEGEVLAALTNQWRCEGKKLPISYHLDYALCVGRTIKALVEIKCRSNELRRYPTVFISLNKIINGKQLADEIGVRFLFVVKMVDGIFYTGVNANYTIDFSGRTRNTRDDADVEPVAHFDVRLFKRLKHDT